MVPLGDRAGGEAGAAGSGSIAVYLELLQREIAAWPDHRDARYAWMKECSDLKRWEDVVKQADALIALDTYAPLPGARIGVDVWHDRAQASFNLGNYENARIALDAAREKYPSDSDLWMLEANLRKKEGRDEAALQAFEQAKAARARESRP